jgi:hypothetical protein
MQIFYIITDSSIIQLRTFSVIFTDVKIYGLKLVLSI